MDIETTLQQYGLRDKEVKIYLALLQLGISSVHDVAGRAHIQRTTTYDILKALKEKGLVSFVVREKKTFFEAAHPAKFLTNLKEKENKMNAILPALMEMKESVTEKPKITIFEGKAGMISLMEDILDSKKHFLVYASKTAMESLLQFHFGHFIERRIKAGIKVKAILNEEPHTKELLEYKIVNKKFDTATFIYGNKVAILSLSKKEPVGIFIENKEIADTQKQVFDLMWQAA